MEKRLAEPEMNFERRQNYLKIVYKNAETKRKQIASMKMVASNRLKKGEITAEERKQIYEKSDKLQGSITKFKITKFKITKFKITKFKMMKMMKMMK